MKLVTLALTLLLAGGAAAAARAETRGDRAATLRALSAALDSHASATAVLTAWCAARGLADPPVIRADRVRGPDKPADAWVRRTLGADPDEPIRYRHVRLTCGAHVLSEADNWYRPGQLSEAMNRRLDETDTPFGAVVGPLDFHRLSLPVSPRSPNTGRRAMLRRRAVLVTPTGTRFSLVAEDYTREVLARGLRHPGVRVVMPGDSRPPNG